MMLDYRAVLEQNLTDSDKRLLKEIYAPKAVGVPTEDARRGLMVMPDGELRCYGKTNIDCVFRSDEADDFYIASRDAGLSWKPVYPPQGCLGACVQVPGKKRFITVKGDRNNGGTYGYVSEIGPDDTAPRRFLITETYCYDMFQPIQISSGRWLSSMQYRDTVVIDGREYANYHPIVMRSDDDGESWQMTVLDSAPRFEVNWPHKGLRWENNGSECALNEMPDGRILLIIRTAQDYFYQSTSTDGGATWSGLTPSPFHGTLTTPFLLRLHDGRVLHFWNNTQPLAEMDKTKWWPPIGEGDIYGQGEDVFTNRDANHVAITEDGENWFGFRELGLNEIRNAADFRSKGGMHSSGDKSVHQFQAIELPYNKVLVAYGQHEISRRLVIFDVDWLYEKEREEHFEEGLKNVTTHLFIKGICCSHIGEGYPGHCAWNRTNGALLMPDPDGTMGEALHFCRIHDPRLFSELEGAGWNFPAAKQGSVTLEVRIHGEGLRISLTDRWFNAGDENIRDLAQLTFTADASWLNRGEWLTLRIDFDTESGRATVFADGIRRFGIKMREDAPNGFSYLHLQTVAGAPEAQGTYVRRMHAIAK